VESEGAKVFGRGKKASKKSRKKGNKRKAAGGTCKKGMSIRIKRYVGKRKVRNKEEELG